MGHREKRRTSFFAPQSRRSFLRRAGYTAGAVVGAGLVTGCSDGADVRVKRSPGSSDTAFAHGVASGDPLADRVMLWSRVTPAMAGDISVEWHLAESPDMANPLRSGTVVTNAERDYTVKVDATGLAPGTTYYYCLLYTSPSPRDKRQSRMPSSA